MEQIRPDIWNYVGISPPATPTTHLGVEVQTGIRRQILLISRTDAQQLKEDLERYLRKPNFWKTAE